MPVPELSCPEGESRTGAYQLSWDGPEGATFRLEEDGEVLYEGPQQASTVTGREEGSYSYRVSVVGAAGEVEWSEACGVTVSHPSQLLAFGLFGVGLVVFVATLAVVLLGHRAHRRGDLG